tara:strand:- start:5586 stop:5909 length:324 start_codon:yes stop_codon:yes gene_type:complete
MLSWSIQIAVISLVVIILIHNIYKYFKSNLTHPSITDYIDRPNEKYNEILNTIKDKPPNINYESSTSSNMKEELKSFLNQQIKTSNEPISSNLISSNTLDSPYTKYD